MEGSIVVKNNGSNLLCVNVRNCKFTKKYLLQVITGKGGSISY